MILLTGMSLLVVFGLLESYVRITQTSGKNFDIEMWRYARDLKRISNIPGMGHEHVPNRSGTYMGVPVTINSVGWRDTEHPLTKPQGTVRIMMLGDSITFGWGAPPEGVTSNVLESMLNQHSSGQQYEVLNTGIGNTNTAMQTAYFTHEGFRYEPDIVVLNYFINDAEPTPFRKQSFFLEHFYSAVFLAGRLDTLLRTYSGREDWRTYYHNLYRKEQPAWQRTQEAIHHLINFCQDQGIKLMIVHYPELHQLSPYPFQKVSHLIAELAKTQGVPFLDLLPAVKEEDPMSLWVTPTDAHPNEKAGKLFASELKRALHKNFPIYFEQ